MTEVFVGFLFVVFLLALSTDSRSERGTYRPKGGSRSFTPKDPSPKAVAQVEDEIDEKCQ